MKKLALGIPSLLLAAALALPLGAQEVTCDDIEFDARAVEAYPQVQDACLEVVDQDGTLYAHLRARVIQNWTTSLIVQYWHAEGEWGALTRATPPEGFTVMVNGAPTSIEQLRPNQEVHLFVPEGRWEVAIADIAEPAILELEFAEFDMAIPEETAELTEAVEVANARAMQDAIAEAEEAGAADAAEEAYEAVDAEQAADQTQYNWTWILVAAAAVVIVWMLIRRRRARLET
jgi:hypothetical protein